MTFDKPILTADDPSLSEGTAAFDSVSIAGSDVVLSYSNVPDRQYATLSAANVTATGGGAGATGTVRVGFLAGDVNRNRIVAVTDLVVVNNQLGRRLPALNFPVEHDTANHGA